MKKNSIEFKNGLIFNESLQVFLTPTNVFLSIIHQILTKEKSKDAQEILKNCLREDSRYLYEKLKKNPKKLEKVIDILNSLGFGKITFKYKIQNEFIFFIDKNNLSKYYEKLFKKKPEIFLENIILGFLETFLELISKQKTIGEIQSQNGKIFLKVKILKEKNKEIEIKKYIGINDLNSYEQSKAIKTVLTNKQLKIGNGACTLWNVSAIFFTYFLFFELTKNLNEEYESFFLDLGYILGIVSVDLQKKLFGVKEELFKNVVWQTDLVGSGKTIYEIKNNKLNFKYINNIHKYSLKYYDKKVKFFNFFICSIIKGIYDETFDINSKITYSEKFGEFELENIGNKKELSKSQKEIINILSTKVITSK